MRRMGRTLLAALVLATSLGAARPARAEFWEDAGWGTLTVLSNLIYMPTKMSYALLGGLTGGLAFCLTGGSLDTAENVWVTSMGGTYAITPGMLRGEESIAFAGTVSNQSTADTGDSSGGMQEQTLSSN